MFINVCHSGTRYTLEVFSDEDGDSFSLVRIEPFDHSPTVHEMLLDMIGSHGEVDRLAREELKKLREKMRREWEEERST